MEELSEYSILDSDDVFANDLVIEVDDDDEDKHMIDDERENREASATNLSQNVREGFQDSEFKDNMLGVVM